VSIQKIRQSLVQVLIIPPDLVEAATEVSQQTGLLSNDALIVAIMQSNGLTQLASHDADFDRVPGITRYGPI
jgi:predicted nucleic acid-binding protein